MTLPIRYFAYFWPLIAKSPALRDGSGAARRVLVLWACAMMPVSISAAESAADEAHKSAQSPASPPAAVDAAAGADDGASPSAADSAPALTAAPTNETAGYVGEDMCVVCHEEAARSYAATIHAGALAQATRAAAERGCEACHGPGAAHVEAGGGKGVGELEPFTQAHSAARRSAPCLRCHAGEQKLMRVGASRHAVSGVACADCHGVHASRAEPLLRAASPALCYGCHAPVRAEFAMPERHRVDEGIIGCADCHDAHGTPNLAALRATNNRECLRCHVEIEGPYVFEHAVVFDEGCARCHVPHGGPNRHLLVRQQVAQICYDCHTVTPADHLQPNFRDCTRCHVAIHGSNVSPLLLER